METKEEWELVRDKVQEIDKGDNEWHIGLMKLKNGTWTWVSGQQLQKNTKERCPWHPGEPTGNGENVAIMYKYYEGKKGLFNDIRKHNMKRFICEGKAAAGDCKNTTEKMCLVMSLKTTGSTMTKYSVEEGATESIERSKTGPVNATTEFTKTNRDTGKPSQTPTSENTDRQKPGASGGLVNSTTIILLLTGIIVFVVAALVLVLVILCRRRSQKKDSLPVSNANGNDPSADAQESLAESTYAVVHKSKKKDKTKKSPELVYVELTLSGKGDPKTVVKPEPYQPTTYAEIRPAQAPPAAANQDPDPTENQPTEDPTYAGVV